MNLQSVILTTGLFLVISLNLVACNNSSTQHGPIKTYEERSQEILDFLIAEQGDSLAVRLNDNILSQMQPEAFIDAIKQYENLFGPVFYTGDWEAFSSEGATIYYKDLLFGDQIIRIITSFDKDNKANSLQFKPMSPDIQ